MGPTGISIFFESKRWNVTGSRVRGGMAPVRPLVGSLALFISACSVPASCGLDGCGLDSLGLTTSDGASSKGNGDGDGDGSSGGVEQPPVEVVHPSRPRARSFVAKLLPGQACPALPAPWVLQAAPPTPSAHVGELMSRYCAYQVDSGVATPKSMPTLDATVVERAMADPLSVLPQASSFTSASGGIYFQRMRESLGVEFKSGAKNVEASARPYVAIVDTADPFDPANHGPDWTAGAARERHGWVMGGIVSSIRCATGASCDSKRQIYAQAFPPSLTVSGADDEARGSVWSLNVAVLRALEEWRGKSDGTTPLVLNLSVGWEPGPNMLELLGGSREQVLAGKTGHEELTPAEEALFITLATASCQGVLTFAAAGNTRGGACAETGMMSPASWEQIDSLSWSECRNLLDEADWGLLGDQPTYDAERRNRLVYGVGGVDEYERPIVNARPDSAPPRVLYSAKASVPMSNGQYTVPWTGTSVATAAMSAIAAQYWAQPDHRRDPAPKIVADLNATTKPVDAGCLLDGPAATVPRIQPETVMSHLYEYVPPTPPSTVIPSPLGATPTVSLAPETDRDAACTGRTITTYSFSGAQTPDPAGPGWAELTPQPNAPICTTCPLTISSTTAEIDLDLDPDFGIYHPTAVLELHLANGGVTVVDLNVGRNCTFTAGTAGTASSPGQPPTLGTLTGCTPVSLGDYSDPTAPNGSNATLAGLVAGSGVRSARLSFYVQSNDDAGFRLLGNEIDIVVN